MRISDWSSDVCSSDLQAAVAGGRITDYVPHRAPHKGGDQRGRRAGQNAQGDRRRGNPMAIDSIGPGGGTISYVRGTLTMLRGASGVNQAKPTEGDRRPDDEIGRANVCTPVTNANT